MSYRCPRCKNENIVDFEEEIHCPRCELDFYKKSIDTFGEKGILAIQELMAFHEVFEEDKNKNASENKHIAVPEGNDVNSR